MSKKRKKIAERQEPYQIRQRTRRGLQYLTEEEKAGLAEFVDRLRAKYPNQVVLVRLFGSKARGDFDEQSDLDVLVIVHDGDWRLEREIVILASRVALGYDVNISSKVISDEHFRELERLGSPLYRNIRRQGVTLWTRRKKPFAST